MHRLAWMLAATSSLALLPSVRAQDAEAATLTASQILQRVAGTYAGPRSYRDAGLIVRDWSPGMRVADEAAASTKREHVPFRTAFVRPASFLFDARGSEKGPHHRIIASQSGDQVRIWEGRAR